MISDIGLKGSVLNYLQVSEEVYYTRYAMFNNVNHAFHSCDKFRFL